LPSPGLGYREAALFVADLHELNPKGFATFLDQLDDGIPFKTAIEANFGANAQTRWNGFAATIAKRQSA
jgi:hypothetical protein